MTLTFADTKLDLFYPFTLTRKPENIRIGALSIKEKHQFLGTKGEIDPWVLPNITDASGSRQLANVTDIIKLNQWSIRQDVALLMRDRSALTASSTNTIINAPQVFIEEGAEVEHCFLNAAEGPIYIAKGAVVMEGALLRGPVAIAEKAVVKMGAKLYAGTSIGPHCIAGGEIKNSILSDYSNKAHDGYLGDSIIGECCNLGAGTSNSNIKNTAGPIKIQLYDNEIDAGNKFGLIMGDYSRAAINTSFNTGTVVGVCCNVFSNGLTPKFIPNFSWGGGTDAVLYELSKAFADIDNWKKLKGQHITADEKQILTDIYKKNKNRYK